MKTQKKILGVVCLGATLITSTADADLVAVGEIGNGGSWKQSFNESGVGLFDLIAVKWDSGSLFESPTHRSFSVGGWSNGPELGYPTPTLAVATGPSTSNMNWDIWFDGAEGVVQFDFVAFFGDTLLESAHARYAGSGGAGGWTITSGNWSPTRGEIESIPLPAPLAMGAMGLLGMGGILSWKRRARG